MSNCERHQSGTFQKYTGTILVSCVDVIPKPGRGESVVPPMTTDMCDAEPRKWTRCRVRPDAPGLVICLVNALGVFTKDVGQDFLDKSRYGVFGAVVGPARSEILLLDGRFILFEDSYFLCSAVTSFSRPDSWENLPAHRVSAPML